MKLFENKRTRLKSCDTKVLYFPRLSAYDGGQWSVLRLTRFTAGKMSIINEHEIVCVTQLFFGASFFLLLFSLLFSFLSFFLSSSLPLAVSRIQANDAKLVHTAHYIQSFHTLHTVLKFSSSLLLKQKRKLYSYYDRFILLPLSKDCVSLFTSVVEICPGLPFFISFPSFLSLL